VTCDVRIGQTHGDRVTRDTCRVPLFHRLFSTQYQAHLSHARVAAPAQAGGAVWGLVRKGNYKGGAGVGGQGDVLGEAAFLQRIPIGFRQIPKLR
jgi:hypothetical protein